MAQKFPTWLNRDGSMTKDGQGLVEWMEAQVTYLDADNDIYALNRQSGPVKHYYTNVMKLKALSREQWLEHYGMSAAREVWRIMKIFEAQAEEEAKQAQRDEQQNEIVEALEEVKRELAAVKKENKRLAKKLKEAEASADEEAADDDDEPEAENPTPEAERGEGADDEEATDEEA